MIAIIKDKDTIVRRVEIVLASNVCGIAKRFLGIMKDVPWGICNLDGIDHREWAPTGAGSLDAATKLNYIVNNISNCTLERTGLTGLTGLSRYMKNRHERESTVISILCRSISYFNQSRAANNNGINITAGGSGGGGWYGGNGGGGGYNFGWAINLGPGGGSYSLSANGGNGSNTSNVHGNPHWGLSAGGKIRYIINCIVGRKT